MNIVLHCRSCSVFNVLFLSLCVHMCCVMTVKSLVGMLQYVFEISNETNFRYLSDWISWDRRPRKFSSINTYCNIRTNKLTVFTQHMCTHNDRNKTLKTEKLQQCNTIFIQNYFQFGTQQYIQQTMARHGCTYINQSS